MIDFELPDEVKEIQVRVASFVAEQVLPVESSAAEDTDPEEFDRVLEDLRAKAREAGLFNPHLPAEWGGLGLSALGMAIVSQECGVSGLASLALNAMAPDEGNMHLLLETATPEQLDKYLRPLAAGKTRSCFAMTEQTAGSDPTMLETTAVRDGDDWILNGEKWFITGANGAAFSIVVAKSDPEAEPRNSYSLFLVDEGTPGWNVIREIPVMGTHGPGGHCEIKIENVRVAPDAVLGELGQGFQLA